MSQVADRTTKRGGGRIPPLENGDCLDLPTFHERYLAMSRKFRAELIDGVVYVPSPLKMNHGEHHALVMTWIGFYCVATPGTRMSDNPTVILGEWSEPQPDAILMIDATHRGQADVSADDYVVGPPELIVEVASSSEAYDMYQKRGDYERGGVLEYVVVLLREAAVRWFTLQDGAYRDLADANGIFRSQVFPGLWLDAAALLQLNGPRVLETLQQGIQDGTHAEFVKARAKRC